MRNVLLAPMWSAVTDPDLNALLHPASAFEHPRDGAWRALAGADANVLARGDGPALRRCVPTRTGPILLAES
jgi:hypothetical protein